MDSKMWSILAAIREYFGNALATPPTRLQPAGLVSVLLDRTARDSEREEAAEHLSPYDEPEALDALVRVASDASEAPELLQLCAESVSEIWHRNGVRNADVLERLTPSARRVLESYRLAAERHE